jgi:hypothetical protein
MEHNPNVPNHPPDIDLDISIVESSLFLAPVSLQFWLGLKIRWYPKSLQETPQHRWG